MPRRKKDDPGSIKENIIAYANERGFTEEFVTESLKNAIIKSYAKQYLGINDIEGGNFDVELLDNNKSTIIYGRIVKDPDDITDDFLEIDSDDEDVVEQGLKVGDTFYLRESFDFLESLDPLKFAKFSRSWKTAFVNSITTAEKEALFEKYKSKINDLVDAKVEKYNEERQSYTVSIGKTMAKLEKNDLIGKEKFAVGEIIKVFLHSIELTNKSTSQQGAVLKISRSSREFLKRVFELNVAEIYDGTVIIKNIARQAGVRSKIAVTSLNPNIDAKGACIGANGNRVQTIVQSNLGNAPEKEKIDIVNYSENLYVYLVEAFSPAVVTGVGITVDENGKKKANVIVRNGDTSLVIGKGGVNVRLAARLCGVDIQIFQQDEAWEKGIDFIGSAEIKQMAENGEADGLNKEKAVAQQPVQPVELEAEEVQEKEVAEESPVEEAEEIEEVEEKVEQPVVEEKKPEAKPEPKAPEAPVEHVNVNVTASILDIEAKLDEEKEKLAAKSAKKAYKKPKKEEKKAAEEESSIITKGMDIYSKEELEDLDAQEFEDFEEEDSSEYDSYDDDSYYDDEN